jgi:hypothetical protein
MTSANAGGGNNRKPADWSIRNHHNQNVHQQGTSSVTTNTGNTASDIVRKYYEEILRNGIRSQTNQLPQRPRAGVHLSPGSTTTNPGTVPANSTETISLSGDHRSNEPHHPPPVIIHSNHLGDEEIESGNSADGSAHVNVNSAIPPGATIESIAGIPDPSVTTTAPTTTKTKESAADDEVIDFIFGLSGSGKDGAENNNQPFRMTTERLAYILIGSCCALSILCLIIVAFSIRCRDMCDEYRAWKKAEKLAVYSHLRYNHQNFPQYPFSGNGGGKSGAAGGRHHASPNSQSLHPLHLQLQQQQLQQQQQSTLLQQKHHDFRTSATGAGGATTSARIETLHDPYGPNETTTDSSQILPLPGHGSSSSPSCLLTNSSGLIHHHHQHFTTSQQQQQFELKQSHSHNRRPIFGPSCCCCPISTTTTTATTGGRSSNFPNARTAAAAAAGNGVKGKKSSRALHHQTQQHHHQSSSDSCPRGYLHPTPRGKLPFGAASSLHQLFPATNAGGGHRLASGASLSDQLEEDEEGDSMDSMIEHVAGGGGGQECTCSPNEPMYVDLPPGQQQQQHRGKKISSSSAATAGAATGGYKNNHHRHPHQHQHNESSNPSWIQSSIIVDELHRKHANMNRGAGGGGGKSGHRNHVATSGNGQQPQTSKHAPNLSSSSGNHVRNNGNHTTTAGGGGGGGAGQVPKQIMKYKRPDEALIFWSGNDDRLI